jgi:predicted transcriptional regulator
MRKSKLESYEAILESLVKEPLNIDVISFETGIECSTLSRNLEFLTANGLVEERAYESNSVHAITERGVAVLKALNFEKYLQKLTNTIKAMDEAYDIIPAMSKKRNENP